MFHPRSSIIAEHIILRHLLNDSPTPQTNSKSLTLHTRALEKLNSTLHHE